MAALHASGFQRLLSLLAAFVLAFSSLGAAPLQKTQVSASAPAVKAEPFAQDHLIVKFKEGSLPVLAQGSSLKTGDARLDWAMQHAGAARLKPLAMGRGMASARGKDPAGLGRIYQVDLAAGQTVPAAVELLAQDPAVEYAEPDYLAHAASSPNDPRYGEQWGLQNINIEEAWAVSQGAPATVIAIVDSGTQNDHPDLTANLWTNPGEVAGNGIDEDNNGLNDDVNGWNFVDQNNNPADDSGHGTLVAGIAAAKTGNAVGIAGVCGNCQVMPVKVMNSGGTANYSDIVLGVNYATVKGARVINLSLGGYANSQALKDAIDAAVAQGIIVVAGAGNDNKNDPFYPAAYENVIAVAGATLAGTRVSTSNYGDWVDVSAPGENLLSTAMGGDYVSVSGTSYAAPFAAGLAGLLKTQNPDWTSAMVRAQLIHTADALAESGMGAGLVDAARAVQPPQPILSLQGYSANGIANGRPDFNSDVTLGLTLYNDWADASGVSATLSTTDAAVSISSANASFGTILAGASGTNATPFQIHIGAVSYNHAIPFKLTLSANDGAYQTTLNFEVATRSSEENVAGTIGTNRTWTGDKTYVVTANLGIAPGVTLTIQPGTVVKFKGNFEFKVGGTLIAAGTEAQPIQFQPYTGVTSWNRLLIDNPSTDALADADGIYQSGTILRHVSISGAANGLRCTTATPYLDKLTTSTGGINCSLGATPLWMTGGQVQGNVFFTGQPINFKDVTINGEALLNNACNISGGTINGPLIMAGGSTVQGTTSAGLLIDGNDGVVRQVHVTGLLDTGANSELTGSTILGNVLAGANSIVRGNTIQNASDWSVNLGANITFTGNRVVDGNGNGIQASSGVIEDNLIANMKGFGLTAGAASIRNNTFTGIKGTALVLSGQPPSALEQNNFEFNPGGYDIKVYVPATAAAVVNGANNWWGTTDASAIQARVFDYNNDYTRSQLVFSPPLSAPSQTAPAYVRGVKLDPPSPVGIQPVNFTVEFSRPMDQAANPEVVLEPSKADSWVKKANTVIPHYQVYAAATQNGKIVIIDEVNGVNEYDPDTDKWVFRSILPTPITVRGVAAANNGKIYVFQSDSYAATTLEEYDPVTNLWAPRANMPTPRQNFGVATGSNGLIYVAGGFNGNGGALKTIEAYDPVHDTWASYANLPSRRWSPGMVGASNGKIYVIGGGVEADIKDLISVDEYDPISNSWTTRANMPNERRDFGLASTSNGKIYAIGDGGGKVDEFDPATNSWATRASMPTTRTQLGVVTASNGKIYAIGGISGNQQIHGENSVEEYTPPGWGLEKVSANPQWLDSTNYRARYDFTSLNARGEYQVFVSGANGTDGLMIPSFSGLNFTLDYAGSISDKTPPMAPAVSAWGDGTLGKLYGSWYSTDPESKVTAYQYGIGTAPGKADVVAWKTTSAKSLSQSGLRLMSGQKYYLLVKARNESGLWSQAGVSSAVVNGRVPAPILSQISPASALPGGGAFTLAITGMNFVPTSVVRWNGANLVTVYVSPTKLTAQVPAAKVAAVGSAQVTVFNPAPGGGSSAVKTFLIQTIPQTSGKVYLPFAIK